MDAALPPINNARNLSIEALGKRSISSPLEKNKSLYISDSTGVFVHSSTRAGRTPEARAGEESWTFEMAGPREKIFFDPCQLNAAVVTCGGLCPGLNDVIRSIVLSLHWQYGVRRVWGFRYGYQGLTDGAHQKPLELTPENVDNIQHEGGTILGSSRGGQPAGGIVETLLKYEIGILFAIGGDGTFRGAHDIAREIKRRGVKIAVVGIPKTIDNDIPCCENTFGFHSAVEEASRAIYAAHEEARAAWMGIGLVKLMGRDSGFIAASATLANSDVDFCFIPELPFILEGDGGFLTLLESRLKRHHHAVVVVSEGAGQDLIREAGPAERDPSGNIRYKDIGLFLKQEIKRHFSSRNHSITIKYIDPSYTIRSCRANAYDSTFCLKLGQHAVHAGLAGKTDMFVGYWNQFFTHVPLALVEGGKKRVDIQGELWQTLLTTTGQLDAEMGVNVCRIPGKR